jgi:outer membrane protein OmpA-like peptidoglycan-associated protein
MLTQDEVRQKLIQKMQERQQQYIAKQIGIPKQILSNFKTGKRELWQSSLQALNDYVNFLKKVTLNAAMIG